MQILDVKATYPIPTLAAPANFITTHAKFATQDILMKSNVVLYCITVDTAYFIQYDDENENLFDTRKHPIVHLSQLALANRLIRMSREDFVSFGKALGVNQVNTVLMFNGVRSGTTAYTQVFNALPGWIAISEIQPLYALFGSHGDGILDFVKSAEFESLTEAVIKCNLKNMSASNEGVFIKLTVFDEHMAPILAKLFPRFKLINAYRNVRAAGKSFHRTFFPFNKEAVMKLSRDPLSTAGVAVMMRLMNTLGCMNEFVKQLLLEVRPQSSMEWYVLQWSIRLRLLSQAEINHGSKIYPLRYEDFMEDQVGTLAKLFDYLGIDQKNIDIALDSLKVDSQEATSFGWKARASHPEWTRTEDSVARCNRILKAFNMPNLDADFVYEDWVCNQPHCNRPTFFC